MSIALKTAALAALSITAATQAAAITTGDLVVYRVGDGSAALTSTSAAVFLDEYSPSGALVQSVALPSAAGGQALTASGSATSEGMLTYNGTYVALSGYNAAAGTAAVSGSTSSSVNRTVALFDPTTGAVSNYVNLSDAYSTNNFRSAYTTDGATVYTAGTSSGTPTTGGIRTGSVGSTTSTQVNTTNNTRVVNVTGGTIYFSTGSGTTGVYQVNSDKTETLVTASTSPYEFAFADLSASVAGVDTLYVANDAANLIQKFSLVGTTWTATGTTTAAGIRGLTTTSGANGSVNVYATSSTALFSFVDTTGYNGAISGSATSIATAGTNTAFRGLAAVPEPASLALLGLGGLAALRRRRA